MIWEIPWPRYFFFLDFFSRFCSLEHSSWVSGGGVGLQKSGMGVPVWLSGTQKQPGVKGFLTSLHLPSSFHGAFPPLTQ